MLRGVKRAVALSSLLNRVPTQVGGALSPSEVAWVYHELDGHLQGSHTFGSQPALDEEEERWKPREKANYDIPKYVAEWPEGHKEKLMSVAQDLKHTEKFVGFIVRAAQHGRVPDDPEVLRQRLTKLKELEEQYPGFSLEDMLFKDTFALSLPPSELASSMRTVHSALPTAPVGAIAVSITRSLIRQPAIIAPRLLAAEKLYMEHLGRRPTDSVYTRRPAFLQMSPENLAEKLQFWVALLGREAVAKMLDDQPALLTFSTDTIQGKVKRLMALLKASEEELLPILVMNPGILMRDAERLERKVEAIQKDLNVSAASAAKMVMCEPNLLLAAASHVRERIANIRKLFNLDEGGLVAVCEGAPSILLKSRPPIQMVAKGLQELLPNRHIKSPGALAISHPVVLTHMRKAERKGRTLLALFRSSERWRREFQDMGPEPLARWITAATHHIYPLEYFAADPVAADQCTLTLEQLMALGETKARAVYPGFGQWMGDRREVGREANRQGRARDKAESDDRRRRWYAKKAGLIALHDEMEASGASKQQVFREMRLREGAKAFQRPPPLPPRDQRQEVLEGRQRGQRARRMVRGPGGASGER